MMSDSEICGIAPWIIECPVCGYPNARHENYVDEGFYQCHECAAYFKEEGIE